MGLRNWLFKEEEAGEGGWAATLEAQEISCWTEPAGAHFVLDRTSKGTGDFVLDVTCGGTGDFMLDRTSGNTRDFILAEASGDGRNRKITPSNLVSLSVVWSSISSVQWGDGWLCSGSGVDPAGVLHWADGHI